MIIGPSNKLAATLLQNQSVKRLYIHGPSGCGKTWLTARLAPGATVVDIFPGNADSEAIIAALDSGDDRVIVTSYTLPRDLPVSDRCKSRLASCVTARMETWTVSMLRDLCGGHPHADQIAVASQTPGAALAAMQSTDAAVAGGVEPSVALASALGMTVRTVCADVGHIVETVADYYRLPMHNLIGKRRTKTVTFPRHVAMYLAKELTNLTLAEIGSFFGGRDHSTVLHGINKIRGLRHKDANLSGDLDLLRARVS